MSFELAARRRRLIVIAATTAMAAGLISGGHHWYGAVAYDTPWRLQVSYWIAVAPLFVVGLLCVYWKFAEAIAGRIAVWFIFVVGEALPGTDVSSSGQLAFRTARGSSTCRTDRCLVRASGFSGEAAEQQI